MYPTRAMAQDSTTAISRLTPGMSMGQRTNARVPRPKPRLDSTSEMRPARSAFLLSDIVSFGVAGNFTLDKPSQFSVADWDEARSGLPAGPNRPVPAWPEPALHARSHERQSKVRRVVCWGVIRAVLTRCLPFKSADTV